MIFTDRTIIVQKGISSINDTIILYRGDKGVEIRFTLNEGSPFKFGSGASPNIIEKTEAAYGQLVIKTPNDLPAIFSEVVPTNEGKIVFTITAEMIDEITEVGNYTFQIRLFDENRQSRATIPEVIDGIEIREPIAQEDVTDTNEVGVATVGYALTTAGTTEDAFDTQGNYNKTTWATGDRITAAKLDKIEAGIDGVNQKVASGGTGSNNASNITITDTGNYFTSTNTEGALQEVGSQIKDITNKVDSGNIGNNVEPELMDMPKVFIYGDALPTTKDNVNLTMDYVSNTTKFSSYIKLKCQGTSSMSYAKKNFTVNMYSDEARATKLKKDFKAWGAQSKFCLKANWVDTTHTRNISGARIAYDMVASRPDSPFKQKLLQCPRNGAVDGFPIKLYFNGEFYGIYTWNIPKDAWMFNMDESNPNHCVLCAEVNNNGNNSIINSCQFRKAWSANIGDWSVEVGTASASIKASFDRCINFVMTATDQEFHDNIGEYFDLYSLLDYYCFSYLTCHLDGLGKNMLMATYDGVIWGACLYDMDSIYGVHYTGNNYVTTNYQCPEQYQETNSLLWQRIEANFGAELYARYLELRRGALSLSNIVKHVEEIYDVIPDRVFADEKAKWTSLPNVNNNTMTRFRNYMRDRAVYVDAQMEEIGTRVPCTGIVLSADTLSFTTTDAQTLSVVVSPDNCTDIVTWSVSPTRIVTVVDGVVTPISNGECTITATCGSYSDTCAVTVSGMSESGGDTGDYTDISYIESTGTQYINTRIVPTTSTKIELVAEMSASKQYDHIFGSDNFMKVQWSDDTGTAIEAVKKNGQNPVSGLTLGKHTYVMDMADTTNVITIDGTKYGTNIGHIESTTNSILLLSGYKNDGTVETEFCGIGKIYSCKIYYEDTLVANMKPILTNSGTYGLLDTVNNTFYASEVGSFTGGDTPSGGDTGGDTDATLAYYLPEPTTFNGTSDYIDTGIQLFDTSKNATVFIDLEAISSSLNGVCLNCMEGGSPWRGISLQQQSNYYRLCGAGNSSGNYIENNVLNATTDARQKIIISIANGIPATIDILSNNNKVTHSLASAEFTQLTDRTLTLGAEVLTNGTIRNYWNGTIYQCKVWFRNLSDSEKDELFS